MASVYTNDLRLEEIGSGEQSGTWGDTTNTNLELISEALSYDTEAITTNADTHTSTVADGAADAARAMYIKYTGTLDSTCTITIAPNTISRVHLIENATSGSQNIIISQGSGANVTIPPGDTKAVYLDGAGSGAAVTDAFASLSVVDLKVQDDLTVTDDATIGGDLTVNGDTITFTSANSQDPLLMLKNTTNDANGARLSFIKDKGAAGASGDDIGTIAFIGDNSAQEQTTFASIVAEAANATDTDEAGKISFFVSESNGTSAQLTAGLIIEGEEGTDGEVDVTIGAATTSLTTIAGDMTLAHDGAVLGFGHDTDVTITHVHNNGLQFDSSYALYFRDTALYIHSSTDGQLDLVADSEIEITAPTIDMDGNTDISGYVHPGWILPRANSSQTAGENLNYWKLGRLYLAGPEGAEINMWTKPGYSSGGTNAAKVTVVLRGAADATALDGIHWAEGEVNEPPVRDFGYVPVSGSDYTFDIYVKLGNFSSLAHQVITGGTWTESVASTSSTSAPTNFVSLPTEKALWLNHYEIMSSTQGATVFNQQGYDQDFRVESNNNVATFFVDGGTDGVGINSSAPISYANGQAVLFIEDDTNPAIAISDTGQSKDYFIVANGSALNFNYADGSNSGSASNITSLLSLDNGGTVVVGKSSSSATTAGVEFDGTGNVTATKSSGNTYYLNDTSANKFYVNANGGIYNYSGNNVNLSDEREKKNITTLGSKWDAVKKWDLKEFHYNADADSDSKKVGVIAQDLEDDHPELVTEFDLTDTTKRKAVKEQQITWMAIKALQEAMTRIETLEAKVATLEGA